MKKFAILFVGVAFLTSGSGCCWWGWPFGYGSGSGYGSGYGYGSPSCPGGNCGVPGTSVPLGTPSGGIYPQNTSMLPGFAPSPLTAGLFGPQPGMAQPGFVQPGYPQTGFVQPGFPQPGLPQTAFNTGIVEALPTY